MISSLWTGISGLDANGSAMGVIGNNIANVNTVGFKGSSMAFSDILSQSLTGASGGNQIGRGVSLSAVQTQFLQGSFESTGSATDMAIDGSGFFVVKDASGGKYYTRAGQFIIDDDGYLVNPDNLVVQGYAIDATGAVATELSDINLSKSISNPKITSEVNLSINLDATSVVPTTAWNLATLSSDMYNYTTSATVYDSLGGAHAISIYFVKTGAGAWTAHYVYTNNTGTVTETATTQALAFGLDGSLTTDNEAAINFVNLADGVTTPQPITFDYGDGTAGGGTGLDQSTQFSSPSVTTMLNQDGYQSGSLLSVSTDTDGVITGLFSNGQTRSIAQVALADFASPWGLTKMGGNLYAESYSSGQPVLNKPGTGGTGTIHSNALEQSNVDLAAEFVKLITTQRGFQANSKVITTSDEMLADVVNLKR